MPKYETAGFDPQAPVIRARVRGPSGVVRSDVPLLIDTGADVSLVPMRVATAVDAVARPSGAPIQFLSGREVLLDQADLAVEFLRYRFRGTFLLVDSPYGVIGRNVLNALALRLDGPGREWSIERGR